MLINLFWLSAPKPLKTTIYIGLGWLVRTCRFAPLLYQVLLILLTYQLSTLAVAYFRPFCQMVTGAGMAMSLLLRFAGAALCGTNEGGSGLSRRMAGRCWRCGLHCWRCHLRQAVP